MKKQQTLIIIFSVILLIIFSSIFLVKEGYVGCNTRGVRSDNCKPKNNRCTPPGDSREATTDCSKYRYYEKTDY